MGSRRSTVRFFGKLIPLFTMFCACFLAESAFTYGQGIITGSINGTVVDPTGAVIPDALAKVVSESNGTTFEVKTNGEGVFQVSDVP